MITLFIDTSFADVSIAIIKENDIIAERLDNLHMEHSKYVVKYIKECLEEAKIDANQIDNIMVCVGPGSFTGVRIGVTIAKTYGYLINKYIHPISSLKELAISCDKKSDYIMSLINARHNNYYVGLYDKNYDEVIPESFMSKDELENLIIKYNPYIVSNEFDVIFNNKVDKVKIYILDIVNYYSDKESVNYHYLIPNYLKLPQAMESKND